MEDEVHTVVIGAGSLGSSLTYHLAAQGKSVVLLDKQPPGSETTARAAGLAMQVHADDALTRISIRSTRMLLNFAELTGQELKVHKNGSLKIARTEADVPQVEAEITRGTRLGVEISGISAREAREFAPWLNPDSALAIWFAPSDIYLTPADLPRAFAKAAADRGATVRAGTTITALHMQGDRVDGVVTDTGIISAANVVIAAGAWTRSIGHLAGVNIPLWPVRHQLCITGPVAGVAEHHSTVRIVDAKTYCRPEGHGLLFGGYEPDPADLEPPGVHEPDFTISHLALDLDPLRRKMADVAAELPQLQSASLAQVRGGLPTMTPDGYFIVDTVPGRPGLWVLSGCNVSGVSNSPALGEDLATWIATGTRPVDIEPFELNRFGTEFSDEQHLRAASRATYSHKYSDHEVGPW